MDAQHSLNFSEKARLTLRHASLLPAALQPDVIMEVPTSAEVNATTTPQGVNHPVVCADRALYSRKIDDSGSSATSDVTPTVTPTDRSVVRSSHRNSRLSPTITTAQMSAKAMRQREALEEQNKNNSNLFIRNLAPEVDQAELDEVFGAYGTILSSAVMRNIHTGESLGTGFVRMGTHEEARAAMSELHNSMIKDRAICIQWAKRHEGAPVGDARKKIMKLFVRNIPLDCTVEALEDVFGRYGCVRQVTLHKDTARVDDPALERLIAFVIYTEEGAAERAAAAVHNTKPFPSCNGIPVMIKLAEDQARNDRNRGQRRSQPVSPQQRDQHQRHQQQPRRQQPQVQQEHQHQQHQQQQQHFFPELADDACDGASFFENFMRSPVSPLIISEYHRNNNNSNAVPDPLTPFDYQLCTATYIPPSVLGPNLMLMRNGHTCTPPSTYHVSSGDLSFTTSCVPFFTSQPVLCSPLMSPLSVNVGASVGPASVHNSSFAGSLVERDQLPQPRPVLQIATPTCANTSSNSSRSSPENSVDGGSRASVVIPNPRSVAVAACGVKRVHGAAARAGFTPTVTRPVISPCPSVESPSVPLSPAVGGEGEHGVEGGRTHSKYRHNPYSMSSPLFVS
jgi:RNA recognition motif-containing protein